MQVVKCGGLNENGLNRPIGSCTTMCCDLIGTKYGFTGGSDSLEEGFEVSDAQARPIAALSSFYLLIWI